ncbi:unnamed protein product [Notodromas monacha]|uniref:Uncharacterized protein n=1 Tax=Notodromas monacha TaxID=399045 RepID=A0A7R9BKT4_9CRUS|nr:unnamed protein product [Notodromas monacha]CAG0917318.1 unnamed protein product [Notodromas monacha]
MMREPRSKQVAKRGLFESIKNLSNAELTSSAVKLAEIAIDLNDQGLDCLTVPEVCKCMIIAAEHYEEEAEFLLAEKFYEKILDLYPNWASCRNKSGDLIEPSISAVKGRSPAIFDKFHRSVCEIRAKSFHSRMASFAVSVLLVLLVVHPDASSGRCHVQDGRLHCSEACDADAVRASEFDGRIVLTGHVLDFGCLDFFGITKVELLAPTRCEGVFRASLVDPVDFCMTGQTTTKLPSSPSLPTQAPSSSTMIPVTSAGPVTSATVASFSTEAPSVVTFGDTVVTQGPFTASSVGVRMSTTFMTEMTKHTTPAPMEGKAVLGAEFATELFSNWAIGLISGLGVTVFGLAAGWITWCLRKKPWLLSLLRRAEEVWRILTPPMTPASSPSPPPLSAEGAADLISLDFAPAVPAVVSLPTPMLTDLQPVFEEAQEMASFAVSVLLMLLVVHPDASSGRCHVQDGRLHCSEACDADAVRASEFDGRIVLTGHVLDFGCLDFFGITKVELLAPTRCEGVFRAALVDPVDFCMTGQTTTESPSSPSLPTRATSSSTMIPVTSAGPVTSTTVASFSTEAPSVVTFGDTVVTQGPFTASSIGVRMSTTFMTEMTKQTTPAPTTSKPSVIISVLKNLPETRIHSGDHANVTLTVVEGKAVLGAEFATELFSNWAIGLISGLGVTVFGLAAGWITWCLRKKPWLLSVLRRAEEVWRILTPPMTPASSPSPPPLSAEGAADLISLDFAPAVPAVVSLPTPMLTDLQPVFEEAQESGVNTSSDDFVSVTDDLGV